MLKTVSRLTVAAFAIAALLTGGASPALAAAPPGWQSVDVTLQTSDQGQKEIVVSGELPASAKLPFQGEIAVPAGTALRWIGEILGGPVADDPALQYVKSTSQGMDVYRFTLSKSRIAQFEGDMQGVTTSDGVANTTALTWTALRKLPEVHLRERLPQGAQVTQPAEGATIEAATTGGEYYTKSFKNVKAGEKLDLTFSYTQPAALLASGASTGSSNNVTLVVILTLVALGFAGMIVAAWRRMPRSAAGASTKAPVRSAGKAPPAPATTAPSAPAKGSRRAAKVEAEPEPPAKRRVSPAIVATIACGVLAVAVAGAVSLATATPVVNGKVTKFFGATSPCDSVSLPVVANQGVDLARQGAAIVDAFTGAEGVGDVTLDVAQSRLDVAFCESSQSEESVRQIVSSTGLVSLGAATPASAPTSDPASAAPVVE